MEFLKQHIALIEKGISQLDFPLEPNNLYDPLRYFLQIGGKRIRPALTMLGTEIFGGNKEDVVHQALAIEIFHNFSLIHDDIMDDAPLRRGNTTVHEKWDANVAILSGDVLLVKAYEQLAQINPSILADSLLLFNRTAKEVCEGQQMDMDFEARKNVSADEYIEMIRLKTSVLLGCALELGAIDSKASKKDRNALYSFGENIGIAFQIQDDILDLYGDPKSFGKQVGGDILANKKTLLLLSAFAKADSSQKNALNEMMLIQDPNLKVIKAKEIFEELNVLSCVQEKKNQYFDAAMKNLDSIQSENKSSLQELATFLIRRNN